MDEETKAKIAFLESEILSRDKIINRISTAVDRLEKLMDSSYEIHRCADVRLKSLEKNTKNIINNMNDFIERHNDFVLTHLERFYDVYYQVFPERVAQDRQVRKQLLELQSKPEPDAEA